MPLPLVPPGAQGCCYNCAAIQQLFPTQMILIFSGIVAQCIGDLGFAENWNRLFTLPNVTGGGFEPIWQLVLSNEVPVSTYASPSDCPDGTPILTEMADLNITVVCTNDPDFGDVAVLAIEMQVIKSGLSLAIIFEGASPANNKPIVNGNSYGGSVTYSA